MARVKLRCIMGCLGLKSSYQEKGLLKPLFGSEFAAFATFKIFNIL